MKKKKIVWERIRAILRLFIIPAAIVCEGALSWLLIEDICATTGFLAVLKFAWLVVLVVLFILMIINGQQFYFDSFVLTEYIRSSEERKLDVVKFCSENNISWKYYNNIDKY